MSGTDADNNGFGFRHGGKDVSIAQRVAEESWYGGGGRSYADRRIAFILQALAV